MIISHKFKYLFIGLPFSASSAITKDLHEKYEGIALLKKHSLYHDFIKNASNEEMKYKVFAVLRNPLEMVVTIYEKMKSNANENYTNSELFEENGGHITKKQREKFNYINNHNASFEEYFEKFYYFPYDNYASLTMQYCDYIINYRNIENDYIKVLSKIGIKNPKKLSLANKTKTKKKNVNEYFTEEIQQKALFIFGPFMKKFDFEIPKEWKYNKVPFSAFFLFRIISTIKKYKIKFFIKKNNRKSIKGTIYGNIQRSKKNIN